MIITFLFACGRTSMSDLDKSLETSGNNKIELLATLNHYSKPSDSLKRKAAIFLIENMQYKKSFEKGFVNENKFFFERIKELWANEALEESVREDKFNFLFDSLKIESKISFSRKKDTLQHISSTYLIKNIDLAFRAWETFPWAVNVDFDDFCNYVLPYRVLEEPLEEWREELMNRYSWVMDSIENPLSIREATMLINTHFNKTMKYCASMKKIPNNLSFSELDSLQLGKCDHLVIMNTYSLRAMGIPTNVEMAQWADHRGGHMWCSIIDENSNLITFDPTYSSEYKLNILDTNQSFNNIPEYQITKRKTAKVERLSFKNRYENIPGYKKADISYKDKQSGIFDINKLDVTEQYSSPNTTFEYEIKTVYGDEVLYLSVYNGNQWKEVAWSMKNPEGNYKFENMGPDIVYLPTIIDKPKDYKKTLEPFVLNGNGTISILTPNTDDLKTIKVKRKYFKRHYVDVALKKLVGGIFQGANFRDFRDAVDLFKIDSIPEPRTNHYKFAPRGNYRYVRFMLPANVCRVAEMKFFKNSSNLDTVSSTELSGSPISGAYKENNGPSKIIDKDVLTYFVSNEEQGGWVGFDFGENNAAHIDSVDFYPPSDGNSIEIGDNYELFYWKDEWVSLGAQVAREEELTFTNCPGNALFILKNHTKGSDVRIFTYEDNNQIWW